MSSLRISGIVAESIVDGPGIRLTLFTQGCPHACPGCHNPDTHPWDGGTLCEVEDILALYRKNPLLSGITLSGGEPLSQAEALVPLAKAVQELGGTVVCYTGYTLEDLLASPLPGALDLLAHTDLLIDGPYREAERDLELRFRGSRNQRILHVPLSLERGEPIWAEDYEPALV